jgi:hypothetical protein
MKCIPTIALLSLASGVALSSSAGEVVYDNLATPLGDHLGGFPYAEAADDFTLAGTGRIFESLSVAYAGYNFDGDETLTVSLYRMDGAPTPGSFGYNTPGTVLFTTTVPIVETTGKVLTFSDHSVGILPETLAVGFAFGGVDFDSSGAGSDAGPLLYDSPSQGASFEDAWLRGHPAPADPFGLFTLKGNPPINLGIQIQVRVPDSGHWIELCGLATLMGLAWFRRSADTAARAPG